MLISVCPTHQGKLVEVEYAMLERKRAVELCEGMDLKKEMEKFGCLSSKGQSRQTERVRVEKPKINNMNHFVNKWLIKVHLLLLLSMSFFTRRKKRIHSL